MQRFVDALVETACWMHIQAVEKPECSKETTLLLAWTTDVTGLIVDGILDRTACLVAFVVQESILFLY